VLDAKPLGLEGVDAVLLEDMKVVGLHNEYLSMLPDGHGFLLGEFGGETKDEADEKAHKLMAQLKRGKGAPKDPTYTGLDVCTPETAATCIAK